jgi:predicted ATPase
MDQPKSHVGRQLGSYTLVSLIGAGGMGEVYLARDQRLGRQVAIKVLSESWSARADERARFEREARLLAALNHPNIAAIYSVEDNDGALALVMELVEGPTLAERLSHAPVAVDETLSIVHQIAEALEAAHERGIVHRDLKPGNVKIGRRGTVKLLDFGIATHEVAGQSEEVAATRLTLPGTLLGTVDYMSPEQARGEVVDPRSDQFSLGLILFEMLTGRHPFRRQSAAETLAAILRDVPPSLAETNSGVPAPLQWIVDRCLARNPDERYSSTRDLAKDLSTARERLSRSPAVERVLGPATLPVPRTPLIGREAELAETRALLRRDDVRLVTFTGTGGTGKTRLALQLAADVTPDFPGGVYFAALSSITDPALVAPTLVQILGVRHSGNRNPADTLKEAIGSVDAPLLLVLDNLEQVLDVAPLLMDLLERCGQLKLLVTSRAVLRVYGEHGFEVPPLERPGAGQTPVAELARNPAVALFVQRAAAVKPDFKLTAENGAAVAEICRKLDGLPLAIELAAARIRMLTPDAMLQRLRSRFELLTGGARDLPARQQTLRATVEWSHGLLTGPEQKLFCRLSVFVGGCTLEAAEAVCNAREDLGVDILDGMESLVGQSLVREMQQADGDVRFTMLETIREYAAQCLACGPDDDTTRRAHAAYCLVLAEEGVPLQAPEDRTAWLAQCDLENDNLRAALEWARRTGHAEWGLRLAFALFSFWLARELVREGWERLNAMLELPSGPEVLPVRARALWAAGVLLYETGEFEGSAERHREALAICRKLGDTTGVLNELNALATQEFSEGRMSEARAMYEECARLSQEVGNEPAVAQALGNQAHTLEEEGRLDEAYALGEQAHAIFLRLEHFDRAAWLQNCLGDIERKRGNLAAASTWYDRALATFKKLGDPASLARTRIDLATLAFDQGERERAYDILTLALTAFRELGNRRGIAHALDRFARFAARCGQAERALRLAGAADAVRLAIGLAAHGELAARARELDEARKALGADALAAEMAGWSMPLEAAIEEALTEAKCGGDQLSAGPAAHGEPGADYS